jgi:apolipoprotein D and lipocalin family protein
MKIAITICFLSLILVMLSCRERPSEFTPVTGFDVARYLGTWYEIARLPNSFEKGMTNVTASYSLRKDGKVKVENAGLKNGKQKTAIGKAKIAGSVNEGFLRVSFFGPFYGDYVIIDLDEKYSYALVASSHDLLWILSRTPSLDKEIVDRLVEKAGKLGFDTSKLYFTPQ